MHTLPPNPPFVRALPDVASERIRRRVPDLPHSVERCITCRGRKQFRWWYENDVVDYECPCLDQFQLNRWLHNAGVGLGQQRQAWRDVNGITDKVLHDLSEYIENAESYAAVGLGLMMYGRNGTGKTLMSNLLLKQLLERGYDGFFTTFGDLLDYFTAGWRNEDDKSWFERRIRHAGILVIDDVGKEHAGRQPVAESTLDLVLRARVSAQRPTLVTTNYTPDELRQNYQNGALSLLRECSQFVEFSGEDYRGNHRQTLIAEAKQGLTRPITMA